MLFKKKENKIDQVNNPHFLSETTKTGRELIKKTKETQLSVQQQSKDYNDTMRELRSKKTTAQILKDKAKAKKDKERFIALRMWISVIAAKFFRDRGSIPPNIGNNIFIGNNQMTTKNSMTAVLYITSFSEQTPVGLIAILTRQVKKVVRGVKIDFVIKTQPYKFNSEDGGFKSRERQWLRIVSAPGVPAAMKKKYARLLYSAEVLKEGVRGFKTYPYILLRSSNGNDLGLAIKEMRAACSKYKLGCIEIKDDLHIHLKYTLMISDTQSAKLQDFKTSLFSAVTLAEILPNTQGMNDRHGVIFGFDKMNYSAYAINMTAYANAKTILTIGPAGQGKTFLALYISKDAHAKTFRLCNTDIKGNEFTAITKALRGIIISMAQTDTHYINTFRLPSDTDLNDNPNEIYIRYTKLSEEVLRIVINPTSAEEESMCSTMVANFLDELYLKLGVVKGNLNSWYRSQQLTAYTVAAHFEEYLGAELKAKYGNFALKALDRINTYMNPRSAASYIFHDELLIENILDTTCLTFDFNMMGKDNNYDETIFKIKFLYSDYMKDLYIATNKAKGLWTWLNDEEAQYATDYVALAYKKDVTLRRAQNCVVNVICNSVSALLSSPNFKPILGNIKIQLIGGVSKLDRDFLVNEYGLQEFETALINIARDPSYKRAFLLVNRLQPKAPTAIIQAYLPEKVAKGKIYKTVDVTE